MDEPELIVLPETTKGPDQVAHESIDSVQRGKGPTLGGEQVGNL